MSYSYKDAIENNIKVMDEAIAIWKDKATSNGETFEKYQAGLHTVIAELDKVENEEHRNYLAINLLGISREITDQIMGTLFRLDLTKDLPELVKSYYALMSREDVIAARKPLMDKITQDTQNYQTLVASRKAIAADLLANSKRAQKNEAQIKEAEEFRNIYQRYNAVATGAVESFEELDKHEAEEKEKTAQAEPAEEK